MMSTGEAPVPPAVRPGAPATRPGDHQPDGRSRALTPSEQRSSQVDALRQALAHRISDLPGVVRVEPTLRDIVAAGARAGVARLTGAPAPRPDGVELTLTAAGADVAVAITSTPTALETAQRVRTAISELLTEHEQRPGSITVTVQELAQPGA